MTTWAEKFLASVLTLLLAIAPLGAAMADLHACSLETDPPVLYEGISHSAHAHHQGSEETAISTPAKSGCVDCDEGCCQDSQCTMSHCAGGSAVTSTTFSAREFDRYAVIEGVDITDGLLAERITPPFRPPQA